MTGPTSKAAYLAEMFGTLGREPTPLARTTTAGDGRFRLEGLPPGSLAVLARADGKRQTVLALRMTPNFDLDGIHPAGGRVCVAQAALEAGVGPQHVHVDLAGHVGRLETTAPDQPLGQRGVEAARHRILKDPATQLACDVNAVLSCSNVLLSWQASVLGPPNALIGAIMFTILWSAALGRLLGSTLGSRHVVVLWGLAVFFLCFATWFFIERTKLGAYLRAATENPKLVQAFGINVPLMITLTYGFGVALAAFAAYFYARNIGSDLWMAIAYTGFVLNLFNLIPISPLDGGRITQVLSPRIWLIGLPLLAALFFCHVPRVRYSVVNGRVVVRDGQITTLELPRLIECQNRLARELADAARVAR